MLGVGVAIIGLGLAMGIAHLYRVYIRDNTGTSFLYYATLQFIDHPYR